MALQIAPDTPDNQRGIVNPQLLIGHGSAHQNPLLCTLPPNCETLIVTAQGGNSNGICHCIGNTTGIEFSGVCVPTQPGTGSAPSWFFDVSNVIDTEVQINWINPPVTDYYVYADAGVHIVADASKLSSIGGLQYVIPSIPGNLVGDRPPYELSWTSFDNVANNTAVLPLPPVGYRYRIFYAVLSMSTAGNAGNISSAPGGQAIVWARAVTDVAPVAVDFKPTGIALPVNDFVEFFTFGPAGTGTIVYSVEVP